VSDVPNRTAVAAIDAVDTAYGPGNNGGLSWQDDSERPHDVYVHVVDQTTLNERIDLLLSAR